MRRGRGSVGAGALAALLGVGLAVLAHERWPQRSQQDAVARAVAGGGAAAAPAAASLETASAAAAPATPPAAMTRGGIEAPPPLERWSERFRSLVYQGDGEALLRLLDDLAAADPQAYVRHHLGYLHARAALLAGELDEARRRLRPYLAADSPFRPLALHHAAAAAAAAGDADEAARLRSELLLGHRDSPYWHDALGEHLAWLGAEGDAAATLRFVEAALPLAGDERVRRDLTARRVAALRAAGDDARALREGLALLFASPADDAAERVATALDHPDVLPHLSAAELRRLADALHLHRRWQRAVEVLELARPGLPRERAEIDFAIGRAHFFAGDYAAARDAYLRAAPVAQRREDQARCLWHAGRAAQLLGDDAAAEELMTRAIAVPGRFAATTAALTGRLRLRVARGDLAAAHGDLQLLRRLFRRDPSLVDGAIAVAMGELAAGRPGDALRTLASVERVAAGPHQRAELAYWRGRAEEALDPARAVGAYLEVLRADVPTHFAYLARQRLQQGELAAAAAARAATLRGEARQRLRRGDAAAARRLQTDAALLSSDEADLALLREIYLALPAYRRVLELEPLPLPSLPLDARASRAELLAALGLLDDATPAIARLYPLAPMRSGLTRSLAYRLAGASRASIQAAESLAEQVPDDFVPQLLPPLFRELLYPRYYWSWIATDSVRHGADPWLLVAIMREESRFNPRAKSGAAARGLMQLLLETARQAAVSLELLEVTPEDLYEPRLVIRLGAKYVGDLLGHFEGDPYAAAAAYNAGPDQARLWRRLAPAPGPDFYLSTISFAESKHYVRKVLNSYERYGEIYAGEPPAGGTRAEP